MMGVFSFFFSSRRRHTRSLCDWSSDVCSSDLRSVRQPPIHILPLPSCNQGRTPETTQATIISEPSVSEDDRASPCDCPARGPWLVLCYRCGVRPHVLVAYSGTGGVVCTSSSGDHRGPRWGDQRQYELEASPHG